MFHWKPIAPAALVVDCSQTKLLTSPVDGLPVGGAISSRPPTPAPVALFTVTVPE